MKKGDKIKEPDFLRKLKIFELIITNENLRGDSLIEGWDEENECFF